MLRKPDSQQTIELKRRAVRGLDATRVLLAGWYPPKLLQAVIPRFPAVFHARGLCPESARERRMKTGELCQCQFKKFSDKQKLRQSNLIVVLRPERIGRLLGLSGQERTA